MPSDCVTVGAEDNPIQLIAFADLECPGCRIVLPKLVASARKGAFRLVIRLCPMPAHPGSLEAAQALARASVAGNGLDFMMLACSAEYDGSAGIQRLSRRLHEETLDRRKEDVAERILRRDISLGHRLGVSRTPTLLLLEGAQPAQVVSIRTMLGQHGGEVE
jgi:protein-disulfide isomerase